MSSSNRRAIAAGIGLAIVALTYTPARLDVPEHQWAAGTAIVIAVLLVDGLTTVRRLLPAPGAAPLTIVATLVAVFLCVPETDQIPIAALLPGVLVGIELVDRRQVGIAWYGVAAASVGWAGLFGATGRQSAFVGALFAWWAVGLAPLVSLVVPLRASRSSVAVAAVGAGAAIVMARTGGIATTGAAAWVAVGAIAVVSFVIAVAVARLGDQAAGADSDGVSATH